MPSTTITDLPPELIDHITTYLPTAGSLAQFSSTNKYIHKCVEADGWSTFSRIHFPSLCPPPIPSFKDVARTLTTSSRAWARRAFIARTLEPNGHITAYPGSNRVERWKRPRGQTIGFTPQIDVVEHVGPTWRQRRELLAYSAGAELCLREKTGKTVKWLTYKPASAYEGRDDITTLHLLRNHEQKALGRQQVIVGTANGDLKLLQLPDADSKDIGVSYFVTQGQPVRSSSILDRANGDSILAASLGDSTISLYPISSNTSKTVPSSSIDVFPTQDGTTAAKNQRVWSTTFISSRHLAVGLGPSDHPLHIYDPTAMSSTPLRKFSLPSSIVELADISWKPIISSVYPIAPLPPSSIASGHGNVFLSGAYDGIVRLHDLRSPAQVEQVCMDRTDDSAIYSLLPRGQETLLVGTARHSLLKVFDMRLGAKAYSYLDATPSTTSRQPRAGLTMDWNLFLRPSVHQQARQGWGAGRHRTSETSIYSIASPSPSSPFIYAGIENSVLELAFTEILDTQPDTTFFTDSLSSPKHAADVQKNSHVVDLAMYDQSASTMKLYNQMSLQETVERSKQETVVTHSLSIPSGEPSLDERWGVRGTWGRQMEGRVEIV